MLPGVRTTRLFTADEVRQIAFQAGAAAAVPVFDVEPEEYVDEAVEAVLSEYGIGDGRPSQPVPQPQDYSDAYRRLLPSTSPWSI